MRIMKQFHSYVLGLICIVSIVGLFSLFITTPSQQYDAALDVFGDAVRGAERAQNEARTQLTYTANPNEDYLNMLFEEMDFFYPRESRQGYGLMNGDEMVLAVYIPSAYHANWLYDVFLYGMSNNDVAIYTQFLFDNQHNEIVSIIISCIQDPNACPQPGPTDEGFFPNAQGSDDDEEDEQGGHIPLEEVLRFLLASEEYEGDVGGGEGGSSLFPSNPTNFFFSGDTLFYTIGNGYALGAGTIGPIYNPTGVVLTIRFGF